MVIQNLNFFDKNGESYNFNWDDTRNMWIGKEWITPISVALFDNSNVFVLEKRNDGSYGFPGLNDGESVIFKWDSAENSSEFFLYDISLDPASQLYYIDKVESRTFTYADYPTFNPTNAPAILGAKLSVGMSSLVLTWRAVPGLPYSYEMINGADVNTGSVIGSGTIPIGDYSLDVLNAIGGSPIPGQVYTVVLSVTHVNGTVQALDFTFTAGFSAVVLGVTDPRFVIQPSELESDSVMQFNVAFNPIEEKGYSRTLKGYYKTSSSETQFLEFEFYGEGEDEDERFRIWLQNFGIKFNREDALILKDYDLTEGLPDWSVINEKRKELLVSKDQVFPYVGTYKGLINFIDMMGYKQTIRVKEYWENQNPNSEYYKKFAQLDITDLMDTGTVGSLDLVGLNQQIKFTKQFKKTNMLALVYEFDELTGNYDESGIPIVRRTTDFTVDQIFFKLNGLGAKVKNEFLPVNVIIKDLIGEFLYFEKYTFRFWYDRVDIRDNEINQAYEINVHTPLSSISDLEIIDVKSLYIQGVSGYPVISFNASSTNPFDNGQKYPLNDIFNWIDAIKNFYTNRNNLTFASMGEKPEWEYSDESSAKIGCPVILGIDNEAPSIQDLDGVSIEETGDNNLTVGGIQFLSFYEVEWIITGLTTSLPYTFSWRGPIVQLNQLPHILPYIGDYRIHCKMYDLYGGISNRYKTISVSPQAPVVLGMMKLEDKFDYHIVNLNNIMVKDLAGSYVYNPKAIIMDNEHLSDGLQAIDIDRIFLDWATYSLDYGFGRSQYSIQIQAEDGTWEDYYASAHPEKKNWGTAMDKPVATVDDYQDATVKEMFHTRLSDYAWQPDFQDGFYIEQISFVPGVSVLRIGLFEPFTIPAFVDFDDLINQLNSTDAPGISNYRWSIVGDKIHASSVIQSKLMHQEWSIQ